MTLLKLFHITCVILSGLGFLFRTLCLAPASPWRRHWAVRWLPHGVDSALLLSGLGLAWSTGQYPGAQSWLTAKLVGLVLYIFCGRLALRGASPQGRRLGLVLAVLCFAYIVSVALTKQVAGFWGVL